MTAAREAQEVWASRPIAERLQTLRALRHLLALRSSDLVAAARGAGDRPEDEILSSEVIPLADACRFLEREAEHVLAPRRLGGEGRPFWLSGVEAEVRREPLGLVLVVAPSNYPLFLPGVQALQALAAGNAVLWKPGRGGSPAARRVAALATEAGLDPRLLTVLPEDPETVRAALDAGVDKVLLTGSASTGRKVLAELASRLVPATMELSGCDALFVLPGADLDRIARAVHFGLSLNGGATCIAPRRVFVPHALADRLGERIAVLLAELPGPMISLLPVSDPEEALAAAARCPYALGASVFGPEAEAVAFASRVRTGVVVVNDVIVPTADPRLPFGGRGESGFGVTRGAEGLLEMTAPKVVSVRRGRNLPHLEERHPEDAALFRAYLTLTHGGGLRARFRGLSALLAALVRRGRGSGRSS